jgi:hypothetical protein
MFSTVYNQCETLGDGLMGELQTKDLENMMDHYWLSPNGYLFLIDTSPCFRPERNHNTENPFAFFEWKPTGIRGRLRPYRRNFIARFYTANNSGEWKEAHAFFRVGKLSMLLPNEEMYYHE